MWLKNIFIQCLLVDNLNSYRNLGWNNLQGTYFFLASTLLLRNPIHFGLWLLPTTKEAWELFFFILVFWHSKLVCFVPSSIHKLGPWQILSLNFPWINLPPPNSFLKLILFRYCITSSFLLWSLIVCFLYFLLFSRGDCLNFIMFKIFPDYSCL